MSSNTSSPKRDAVNAVILCWPSINICFPSEEEPSFNFTSGLFQVIIYPTGYSLYNESIRSLTLVVSHTNGLCISGIAIVPSFTYPNMVSTLTLFTLNYYIISPLYYISFLDFSICLISSQVKPYFEYNC